MGAGTDGELSEEFLEVLKKVRGKRPRVVIDHILEHGLITTEELEQYGYKHPPRAARDVREAGIPLVTTSVMSSDGRRIGAYAFGTPEDLVAGLTGRTAISKAFKQRLVAHQGAACTVCGSTFEENYLQVDHRIPVEVGGDEADGARGIDDYMLLDAGCNRAKSWACEHCPNRVTRDLDLCATCFWAQPDGVYEHVATIAERRTMLTWQGDDAAVHDRLATKAKTDGTTVSDELKRIAREVLDAD